MDIDLCHRIQCGAVSQAEAGMATLLECSQAGLVGVFGCGHPNCAAYAGEMRARGLCPPMFVQAGSSVLERAGPAPVPFAVPAAPPPLPLLAAPFPSITPARPEPVQAYVPEGGTEVEPWYCSVNRWADQNRGYAVLVLAGVYLALGGWKRSAT